MKMQKLYQAVDQKCYWWLKYQYEYLQNYYKGILNNENKKTLNNYALESIVKIIAMKLSQMCHIDIFPYWNFLIHYPQINKHTIAHIEHQLK